MLKDRLALALSGPPKVSQAALARATNTKPSSVSCWVSGETEAIESQRLLAAAAFLNVSPDWLATGKGEMRAGTEKNSHANVTIGSHHLRLEPLIVERAQGVLKIVLAISGMDSALVNDPRYLAAAIETVNNIGGDTAAEGAALIARIKAINDDGSGNKGMA